jgi:HEPN domain-containing protein
MGENSNALIDEWIRKADHDLGMARLGIENGVPFTDGICFHCQQASEK